MNPFKQKPQKPKLTTRFNISMTARHDTNQAHRLHSSKEADDNTVRYRNHISFLECRIEQQEATIQKMQCQIQASLNVQAKLNAQVLRLQRSNKNMLDSLYDAENQIRELEEHNNNQMLHQSIEKIQHQLNMTQVRKRNRTLELSDNPERSTSRVTFTKKSVKTSQRIDSEQPSFKLPSLMSFLKLSSCVYAVNVSPGPQKPPQVQEQTEKISKLELAIYSLKKQLREQEKAYEQKIAGILEEQKKAKSENKNELQAKILENENRMSRILQRLEMKDLQIMEIEERYAKQLVEAEQVVLTLNQNIKEIVEKKQAEVEDAYTKMQLLIKRMKDLQDSNHRANEDIEELTESLEKEEEKCSQLQKELAASHVELHAGNQPKLVELIEEWTQTGGELLSDPGLIIQDDTMSQLENSYQERLSSLANQLKSKTSLLEEENMKTSSLLHKMETMQSLNCQISQNQHRLAQQVAELEDIKQNHLSQISQLKKNLRFLEGELAEKQYIANDLTEQMMAIKDKLTVLKADQSCQTLEQANNEEDKGEPELNMDQLQDHFSMILKQKEQEYHVLQAELEKERSLCQHFEKEIQKYCKQIEKRESELEETKNRVTELEEVIARHEGELVENKHEISSLQKNVHDLQEKEAFFEDYIQQFKAAEA